MRKSVALFAIGGVMAAVAVAVLGLWLPARHHRQDIAWQAAGERALAQVAFPSSYSDNVREGRDQPCSNGPTQRCFLGPGDPRAQVETVTTAFANVAGGSVTSTCASVPLPGSPSTCRLTVPVAGSRLAVSVFARPTDRSVPIAQWRYSGAYVLIHVDQR